MGIVGIPSSHRLGNACATTRWNPTWVPVKAVHIPYTLNEESIEVISTRKVTFFLASLALGAGLALGPAATSQAAATAYSCNQYISNGYIYMGNSTTMTINTKRGQTGARVAEVQCLLEFWSWYWGDPTLDPKGHDGSFGANTERAVINAQKALFPGQPSEWDGEVGPKTWPALRDSS